MYPPFFFSYSGAGADEILDRADQKFTQGNFPTLAVVIFLGAFQLRIHVFLEKIIKN